MTQEATSPPANGIAEKAFDSEAVDKSVQVIPRGQGAFAVDTAVLYFAASAADGMQPWGRNIKLRDAQLRAFIPSESLFASALGTVASRNAAFSWKLEGPEGKVDRMQSVLQSADWGQGWQHFVTKISIDLYTQDQGAFFEVIRERDSEEAEVVGVHHMDSSKCYPTGLPETPVMYQDREGKYHLMKWYQVVHLMDMPTTYEGIPGTQYCALTRLLRASVMLRDITQYLSEKVGGRNTRAITLVKGVTTQAIQEATRQAQLTQDAMGFARFGQPVFVGSVNPLAEIGFETLELASLPDGFDLEVTQKQYILQLAMAFQSDYQEFAPLPGGGLGTSAQSEILHMKTRGKGPGLFMAMITQALNWSVLPEDTEFMFDEQDVEADKAQAEQKLVRAEERAARIASGELNPQVARMIAYEVGDLTEEQLKDLEKADDEAKRQEEEAANQFAQQQEQTADQPMPKGAVADDGGQPASQRPTANETDVEGEDAPKRRQQRSLIDRVLGRGKEEVQGRAGDQDARLDTEAEVAEVIQRSLDKLHDRLLDRIER